MSKRHSVSRRQFLQTAGAAAGGIAVASMVGRHSLAAPGASLGGRTVRIHVDREDSVVDAKPVQWALEHLRDTFTARGIATRIEPLGTAGTATKTLWVTGANAQRARIMLGRAFGREYVNTAVQAPTRDASMASPESFNLWRITSEFGDMLAVGRDPQGLVYALTEMADRARLSADPLAAFDGDNLTESPATPYRGIFRMFTSEFEDKRWFYDREGWQKYFDMLVTHRFNRFNLSFGLAYDFSTNLTDTYAFFLYPFLVNVPGYRVRAIAKGGAPLPDDEQKKNLDTLKFISDQAALRGLKFTLGIWTHNYRWTSSPNATYTIEGLDAQTQAPYSRDAMKMVIDACPGITGINLRTHGESGVPEGSYDLWKIIMSGIMGHKNADGSSRIIDLDLHGKTMTQQMIDTATTTGMPLIISCKHWAEHMGLPYIQASIRESEMPKDRDSGGLMALSSGTRSFLRYGIGDLLRKDRNYKIIHRVWSGTQHILLWGDPLYAAELGRMASFAGTDGIDFFEPLSFRGRGGSSTSKTTAEPDRSGYAEAALRTPRDWEKYLYTFRLWGRLSYNPDAAPETWRRQLQSDFGPTAQAMETALASVSRILPLVTTAHDCAAASDQYWPEMYTNQSIFNPAGSPYSEAPNPKVFGNVSPLDPQLFATPIEYVDGLLAGRPVAKISPLEVAQQLDAWSNTAFRALTDASAVVADRPSDKSPGRRRASVDATIAAGLGRFFANKFRTAILWQLFTLSGHAPARTAAQDAYKKARDAWAALASEANVYLPNLNYGSNRNLRGHWSDRLAALDNDVAGLATRDPQPRTPAPAAATIDRLILSIVNPVQADMEAAPPPVHTAPAAFKPNQPLTLEIGQAYAASVRLCYRHINQGERFAVLDMQRRGDKFTAAIPAAYTDSPFPLQYYFELHSERSASLFPGFKEHFTGTPYFVVPPT